MNDDINKAVWSALEFDSSTPLREILEDYSRLFFPGTALMGASGIVFMMIIISSLGGMRGGIPITLILVFVIYIGGEIYNGITTNDNISQITHIVGGIIGAIMGIGMRARGRK